MKSAAKKKVQRAAKMEKRKLEEDEMKKAERRR